MVQCYMTTGNGLADLQRAEISSDNELEKEELLIDIHATSLNYRDLLVVKGRYGNKKYDPFVICSDMSGVVATVGENVTEFKKGDRVVNAPFRQWPAGKLRSHWARTLIGGAGVNGVLTEQVIYPSASIVKLPDYLSFEEGSTLPIAGLTAWAALVTFGKIIAGDWVLLHGTGGVSIFGAQIAKMFGARTILTTSSEEKGRIVQEKFGVDAIINYQDKDWPSQVKKITQGSGADIVVEVAGGASLGQSIKASSYGGRVAVIGMLAGLEAQVNIIDLIHHQVSVRGIYVESTEELRAFIRALDASKVHPHIDKVFSFEEASKAYKYLDSQEHIGKVVIKVNKS